MSEHSVFGNSECIENKKQPEKQAASYKSYMLFSDTFERKNLKFKSNTNVQIGNTISKFKHTGKLVAEIISATNKP